MVKAINQFIYTMADELEWEFEWGVNSIISCSNCINIIMIIEGLMRKLLFSILDNIDINI